MPVRPVNDKVCVVNAAIPAAAILCVTRCEIYPSRGHILLKEQFRSSTVHLPKAMFSARQVSAGVGPEGFVFQEI